jgi:hypothetical protein
LVFEGWQAQLRYHQPIGGSILNASFELDSK